MKITQKQMELVLLLLIVVIGVAVYRFGYYEYDEKTKQVESENKQLEQQIAALLVKQANKETYEKGIEDSEKLQKEVLAKYGPGNTPEKSIMMIRDLEEKTNAKVQSIAFNPDSSIYMSADTDENGEPSVKAYTTQLSISYENNYEGLKKMMDYFVKYPERMNVSSFTAVFNQETGALSGTMLINLFSVQDANHKYKEPSVGGVKIGTDNIFGDTY